VVEIKLKKGESVEKALRRLKKKMDKEGTMKEIRGHRYFEKPSEKRRKKAARARINSHIAARMSY
jgi:small subunit ribosomal protein S21